ncbi:MAG: hypothetical protein ACYTDT_12275 [Planctomycetota bacterium]
MAATLEAGSIQQDEVEVSDLTVVFAEGTAEFSTRIRVKGRAWPPRPPIDTSLGFSAHRISVEDTGTSGSVAFTIQKPLTFSSKFVDLLASLIGKLLKDLPVSLDDLRKEGNQISLDFAEIVRTWQPEMTVHVDNMKLFGLTVSPGKAKLDIGFQ